MKIAGAICLLLLNIATMPAWANPTCLICDTDIWMNEETKKCFVSDINRYVDEMTSKGSDFVTVSFDTCGKSRGGLMTLPTGSRSGHKSSYVLDKNSLSCLYTLLTKHTGSLDPFVIFKLEQECK